MASLTKAHSFSPSSSMASGVFAFGNKPTNPAREAATRRRQQEAYIEEHNLQALFDKLATALAANPPATTTDAEMQVLQILAADAEGKQKSLQLLQFKNVLKIDYALTATHIEIQQQSSGNATLSINHSPSNGALNDTILLAPNQCNELLGMIRDSFSGLFVGGGPTDSLVELEADGSGKVGVRHPNVRKAVNAVVNEIREIRAQQRMKVQFNPIF